MRTCDTAGAHRYSPPVIDIHYVVDMSLRTRYVLRTRKVGEYHIEIDRKGDYIEFAP